MVVKTDKSGRFIVTTPEKYIEMGKEHTNKDEEITFEEMKKYEKVVAAHTVAWDVIWRTGQDHGHLDRIVRSRNTRSGNNGNLSLLFKDHKQGNKTRPVASGNESYNLGLSNGVSDFLESVAKAKSKPYAVISAEDMLARITRYNEEWKQKIATEENRLQNPDKEDRTTKTDRNNSPPSPDRLPLNNTVPTEKSITPNPADRGRTPDHDRNRSSSSPDRLPLNTTVPTERSRLTNLADRGISPNPDRSSSSSSSSSLDRIRITSTVPIERRVSPDLTDRGRTPSPDRKNSSSSPDRLPLNKTVPTEGNKPPNPADRGITTNLDRNSSSSSSDRLPLASTDHEQTKPGLDTLPEMRLVGSDVVALYPSITADRTDRINREEVIKSDIKIEGLDVDRAGT